MAEYCSICTPLDKPDFDLAKIALHLKLGRSESFLCEGCNTRGVYKDENGNFYLAKEEPDRTIKLHPVTIEDLM